MRPTRNGKVCRVVIACKAVTIVTSILEYEKSFRNFHILLISSKLDGAIQMPHAFRLSTPSLGSAKVGQADMCPIQCCFAFVNNVLLLARFNANLPKKLRPRWNVRGVLLYGLLLSHGL